MPKGDFAVRSFLKYARLGIDRRNFSSLEVADRLRGYCSSEAEAARLLAVHDTLRILRVQKKTETEEAVRAVYFRMRGRAVRKNDVSLAVTRFACEKKIDVRTVWRRLEYAKRLYNSLLLDMS